MRLLAYIPHVILHANIPNTPAGHTGVLGLRVRMSPCMLIVHKDYKNTKHIYSVTVITRVMALEVGQSSQGTFQPITPKTHSAQKSLHTRHNFIDF